MTDQIQAVDRVQPAEKIAPQGDSFNRQDLYNGASGAGKPNDVPGATHKPNDMSSGGAFQGDHIDFSKADNPYASSSSGRGDVQQVGLSGSDSKNRQQAPGDGKAAQSPQAGPDGGTNRLGMPNEQRGDIPKDGVIRDRKDAPGQDVAPGVMQKDKSHSGPFPDGGMPSSDATPVAPSETAGSGDRTLATTRDGKVNDVSHYSAKDNQLTDYKLNDQGDVASRTTTDMNNNSVDTVQYGADGRATSHQIAADGQPARDVPVDSKEQVISTTGRDGKVNTIETTNADGTNKISLDASGKPTAIDSERVIGDQSATRVHQELDENGQATSTDTKSYDGNGRLRTAVTEQPGSKDTKTYDDNHNVVRDDYHSDNMDQTKVNTADGSATATKFSNGLTSAEISGRDGSSYSSDYSATFQSGNTKEQLPDGSTRTTTEDPGSKNVTVTDKNSGVWASETTDKRSGAIHKRAGAPGMENQVWTEEQI